MSFHPFGRGARGDKVGAVHARLVELGLLTDEPATDDAVPFFDTTMATAVRYFQQSRGLTVDGIVGPETFRALEDSRWRLGDRVLFYSPGRLMTGDDVGELQRRLLELGFNCGKPDGFFGTQTETALRDFQRNTGLQVDGTCGPRTFKAFSRLARTVVGGQPHALWESARLYRNGHQHAGRVLIIDPGHGPADPGIGCEGVTEAELVWDIAARIEGRLTALGVQAYLSRGRHGDPDDQTRATFANETDADMVVSLHMDGHENPAASGVATYYFGSPTTGQHSAAGKRFAELVLREMVARTDLLDCRAHPKSWDLLRLTKMPAVRIDAGYLTNPGDRERLRLPEFRDTIAESVCAAVQRLFLPPDHDAPTGTLHIPAALRAG
ncbi:MAG: N-acetylmuramoyl-L-alanine amidase [Streptosporangiales bacterium]|nr:N-acetylmuramoyl-L-alanine amidase [Streptosporangiales bacterium]